MANVEKEIIKTLAYSDCFNYPLTFPQIWQYLITTKKINKKDVADTLEKISAITNKEDYFFLKGRDDIVEERKRKEKISLKKLLLTKYYSKLLSLIPSVIFIGISGSLAMHNADENDDIDFFIISSPGTVWLTRFICVLLLILLGVKRKRIEKSHKNKICLNMFVDASSMILPHSSRNIYTAHEVAQLMPIINKNEIYEQFLKKNAWVLEYMPNSFSTKISHLSTNNNSSFTFLSPFEIIARRVQIWYMRKHQTTEKVSDTYIAFHPGGMAEKILKAYANKYKSYKI